MHGFAGFVAQRARGVARGRAQARAAPAAAGQLHQAMAQRPAAGRADLHQQPLGRQRRHDPVHGGTRKTGGLGDLGDAHGLGIVRHPLQHAHELGKRGGASDAIVGGVEAEAGVAEDMRGTCVSRRGCGRGIKANGKAEQHNPPLTPGRCRRRLKTTLGHHISPSTGSTTPVMKRQPACTGTPPPAPRPPGCPSAPAAVRARMGPARAGSSCSAWVSGVAIQPGATALTRMPSGA